MKLYMSHTFFLPRFKRCFKLPSSELVHSIVLLNVLIAASISCSPPIDFLRYTSTKDGKLEDLSSLYSDGSSNLELSNTVLKLVQNSSHTHDNDKIDLRSTRHAWHLMDRQALRYMDSLVKEAKPYVEDLLREANVSSDCRQASIAWLDHLAKLDLWATIMWNSWGDFPPAGILKGSFTDLGSYPACMSIEPNSVIGEPQYCMLDFQPLVPTRPRFHSILKKVLLVDENRQITGGDFDQEPRISSKHSSHGFGASHYHGLARTTNITRYLKRTISVDPPTVLNQEAIDSNSSIRAEVIAEFAKKAQYFYYVKFRLGACLPSRCSPDDVQKMAQTAGQRAILQSSQVNCLKKETFNLNTYQWVAIVVLSSLALVAVLGTVVDLLGLEGSGIVEWLLLFSIWTNGRKLFVVDQGSSHSNLEVVHGLRFFSMIWVIYGHTILYTEYQAYTHFFEVVETKISSLALLPTLNANFSVDTFFVISGVLTTYVTWEFTRGDPRKFNKLAFALSRYIRLTPQLSIVILLFFLLPLTGEGPLFKQVTEYQADLCYKGWLTDLLYLQSYTDSEKICIDPSWWLSIEMSFHLISILIISVLVNNVVKGLALNFGIAAILTAWGAYIHYANGFAIQYLPSIPQRYEVQSEQTKVFFHRLYPHAPSYFIGTWLGYLLATRTIKRLSNSQLIQGWLVCVFGFATCLLGCYYWNQGAPYTQLQATLYYHICQIMWPLSVAWIIFVCSLGQGGMVHSILAAPVFAPLGRITYMTYLSHALIIYYQSACTNIPVEPAIMSIMNAAISNTFLALLFGMLLTVVYESPLLNLQKHLIAYLSSRFEPTSQATDKTSNNKSTTIVLDTKDKIHGFGQVADNETSKCLIP